MAHFGQWESLQGLVDIPRMCLLWVSFSGRRTVWVLKVNENNKFRRLVHDLTSGFNVTRQGSAHCLQASVRRCTATHLVLFKSSKIAVFQKDSNTKFWTFWTSLKLRAVVGQMSEWIYQVQPQWKHLKFLWQKGCSVSLDNGSLEEKIEHSSKM